MFDAGKKSTRKKDTKLCESHNHARKYFQSSNNFTVYYGKQLGLQIYLYWRFG